MTTKNRFTCTLFPQGETCDRYARVTIVDQDGDRARACPKHAMAALEGIDGARVDWPDSKGLNEFEVKALELTEEIAGRRR
jgi:hypothetical protein